MMGLVQACSNVSTRREGKPFHRLCIKNNLANVCWQTSFVFMNMKCGFLHYAVTVFKEANDKDDMLWGAVIDDYVKKGLPPWANTSCVSIDDVIQGDILVATLSNYMVDIDWSIPACSALSKIPNVLVIHGESDGRVYNMKRTKAAIWMLYKPPLPISFGTRHSKAMLLVYPHGVRVIVHTENLIYVDWNNKSQGLWMQYFPLTNQDNSSKGSGFENDLIEYLNMLKWPEFSVKLPSLGNFSMSPSFFKKFDYSNVMVRLIATVPRYHVGASLKWWGHMKLRSLLQECTFDKEFKNSPLVYYFSSLGSLDEKWMAKLASSMSASFSEDKTPLGNGKAQIIWPTVEDVRCSLEGYAAGNAIPSPLKNVEKYFLKKILGKMESRSYMPQLCLEVFYINFFNIDKTSCFLWQGIGRRCCKLHFGSVKFNNSFHFQSFRSKILKVMHMIDADIESCKVLSKSVNWETCNEKLLSLNKHNTMAHVINISTFAIEKSSQIGVLAGNDGGNWVNIHHVKWKSVTFLLQIGAAMFIVNIAGDRVLYTGGYSQEQTTIYFVRFCLGFGIGGNYPLSLQLIATDELNFTIPIDNYFNLEDKVNLKGKILLQMAQIKIEIASPISLQGSARPIEKENLLFSPLGI